MVYSKIEIFILLVVATIILCREEMEINRPAVAWVPILARNITEAMRSVLEYDTNKDEKLRRIGKMLTCWVPAQFTGAWEKYAETYCFIKGSYFLPDDQHPNDDFIERDKAVIGYYQWVPLMLAFQSFLFYAPCLFWRAFNFSTGINVKEVLESSAKVKKNVTIKEREIQVTKAAIHLQEVLELQRELKIEAGLLSKLRKSGFYLSLLYVFTKLLYVVNIFLQFCIFSAFLGTNSAFWGWEIFTDIWQGREWNETGHFPRVTMCDFTVLVYHRWSPVRYFINILASSPRFWQFSTGICLETNGGDILAGEIIASMFRHHNERRKPPTSEDSFGDSPDTTATLPR
uniref:Innexin n=1 Tax=Heterorhabditis bacteriophora TaxID=37862 RepID=A0A1I7XVE8_HETBA